MNEKKYEKRLDFQKKIIDGKSKEIESLKSEIENLKVQLEEKDRIIHSVDSLRDELAQNVSEIKKYKEQYCKLVSELKKMKNIVNEDVYKNRWWLIKHLIK